jgi:hypothetical protein
VSTPLARPKRKNPLARTRLPLLPAGPRSRTAHGLTQAAADGRFALRVCEWFQTILPPKLAPAALAKAVVAALKEGVEDVFVGDIAQDIRERLKSNPKALERELGSQ